MTKLAFSLRAHLEAVTVSSDACELKVSTPMHLHTFKADRTVLEEICFSCMIDAASCW
jgi:hypothetical protein